MIYFTSDLHFGHNNVMRYCNRPFNSVDDMDATLIRNWNNTVQARDTIYILGDISLKGPEYINELMPTLQGKKHLIYGNHDLYRRKESFNANHFASISPYLEVKIEERWFIMFHYPILEWNHQHHGAIHMHGHIHATPRYNAENAEKGIFRFDAGVDANAYCPVSAYTILNWASGDSAKVDHHYRE